MSVYWVFEERSIFQCGTSNLQTHGLQMGTVAIHCIVKSIGLQSLTTTGYYWYAFFSGFP